MISVGNQTFLVETTFSSSCLLIHLKKKNQGPILHKKQYLRIHQKYGKILFLQKFETERKICNHGC